MKKLDKKALSKIGLRILSGAIAIAAIIGLAIYSDSKSGNIVSLLIAEFKMKSYMYDKYSALHLDYLNTYYDQFSQMYKGEVSSPDNPDVKFSITCYQLRMVYDNYNDEVASGKTKLERLEKEYGSSTAALLVTEYPQFISSVYTTANNDPNSINLEVTIKKVREFSPAFISDLLTRIDKTLTDSRLYTPEYASYGLTLDVQTSNIPGVYGVTPELIHSGQLESILNQALTEPEKISKQYGIQYYPE